VPIRTPTTCTTLDANAPTSSVLSLPTQSPSSLIVCWSGPDDAGGSGISTYDIFVSEDGGEFNPFVTVTTANSALFPGEANRSSTFFRIATDHGGLFRALAASIASLDVNGTGPFSNFLQLGDVNNNRAVTAGDALAIIIELNQRTFSNNAG
jgi:hypothetical protein